MLFKASLAHLQEAQTYVGMSIVTAMHINVRVVLKLMDTVIAFLIQIAMKTMIAQF